MVNFTSVLLFFLTIAIFLHLGLFLLEIYFHEYFYLRLFLVLTLEISHIHILHVLYHKQTKKILMIVFICYTGLRIEGD